MTGEANAQALLALCEMCLGNAAASECAAARAKALRAKVTERMEVFGVDVTLPLLATNAEERDVAIANLSGLADEADRRGWLAWSLGTRLALLQLLESAHDRSAAGLRDRLAGYADRYRFRWLRKRMG